MNLISELLGWKSSLLPLALSVYKDKIRCSDFLRVSVCMSLLPPWLVVKAERVCVTCLGWWSRGGSHGLLYCVMSVPCLTGAGPGQMQPELCCLTSSGWSVPSIQRSLSCSRISHASVSSHKWPISIYCADYVHGNNSLRCSPDPWLTGRLYTWPQRGHRCVRSRPDRL